MKYHAIKQGKVVAFFMRICLLGDFVNEISSNGPAHALLPTITLKWLMYVVGAHYKAQR